MADNRVKLTIALQTHNRADGGYLKEMLDSILAQTHTNFELLVMDNHSTDGTVDLISSYTDPRMTYVRQPPGGNATTNTNRAVWMSRGTYILMTHDDDILEPDMVEKQLAYFEAHPETICVAANVSLMDQKGKHLQDRLYPLDEDRHFEAGEYIENYLQEKFWLPTPTMMYRRDAYMATQPNNVRMVNPPYFPSGDIWSIFMFNLRGPVAILAEPLLRYRQHDHQESRLVNQSEPMLQLMDMLLKRKSKHPLVRPLLQKIDATYLKYKAQDILFKEGEIEDTNRWRMKFASVFQKMYANIEEQDQFSPEAAPAIALAYLADCLPDTIQPDFAPSENTSLKAYARWAIRLQEGGSLLTSTRPEGKLCIFGSMLTAQMLVLDARRSNIENICIFDSSPARIGKQVQGIEILPAQDLSRHVGSDDMIILSSERDHEAAILEILRSYLGKLEPAIVSWKELAGEFKEARV